MIYIDRFRRWTKLANRKTSCIVSIFACLYLICIVNIAKADDKNFINTNDDAIDDIDVDNVSVITTTPSVVSSFEMTGSATPSMQLDDPKLVTIDVPSLSPVPIQSDTPSRMALQVVSTTDASDIPSLVPLQSSSSPIGSDIPSLLPSESSTLIKSDIPSQLTSESSIPSRLSTSTLHSDIPSQTLGVMPISLSSPIPYFILPSTDTMVDNFSSIDSKSKENITGSTPHPGTNRPSSVVLIVNQSPSSNTPAISPNIVIADSPRPSILYGKTTQPMKKLNSSDFNPTSDLTRGIPRTKTASPANLATKHTSNIPTTSQTTHTAQQPTKALISSLDTSSPHIIPVVVVQGSTSSSTSKIAPTGLPGGISSSSSQITEQPTMAPTLSIINDAASSQNIFSKISPTPLPAVFASPVAVQSEAPNLIYCRHANMFLRGRACGRPRPLPGKKGIGLNFDELRAQLALQMLQSLDVYWNYGWHLRRSPFQPTTTEFIPMAWNGASSSIEFDTRIRNASIPSLIGNKTVRFIMGFNEPDHDNQAGMDVAAAIDRWSTLQKLGIPLVSPSPARATGPWMKQFMGNVSQLNLRIDYIGVHSYGGANVTRFQRRMTEIHDMYGLPLVVTELACADWKALNIVENRYSPSRVLDFMKQALPWMEQTEWIIGYSWFPFNITKPIGWSSALFDVTGNLTALGRYYKSVRSDNVFGDQTIAPDPDRP
jgi:Glycosyl hydrolase catalytic core